MPTFSSRSYLLTILLPPAITRELCKYDAHGNQDKTNTLTNYIVTVPKASKAAVLEMEEAVTQADNAVDRMAADHRRWKRPPFCCCINGTKSVSQTWGPLLQKDQAIHRPRWYHLRWYDIKMVNSGVLIMTRHNLYIHPYAKMAWSILSATQKACPFDDVNSRLDIVLRH